MAEPSRDPPGWPSPMSPCHCTEESRTRCGRAPQHTLPRAETHQHDMSGRQLEAPKLLKVGGHGWPGVRTDLPHQDEVGWGPPIHFWVPPSQFGAREGFLGDSAGSPAGFAFRKPVLGTCYLSPSPRPGQPRGHVQGAEQPGPPHPFRSVSALWGVSLHPGSWGATSGGPWEGAGGVRSS